MGIVVVVAEAVVVVINDDDGDDSDNDENKNNNRRQNLLPLYFVLGTVINAIYTLSQLNLKKKRKQKPTLRSNCYSQTCFTDKRTSLRKQVTCSKNHS